MREMGRKKMHTKGDSLTILLHKHTHTTITHDMHKHDTHDQ